MDQRTPSDMHHADVMAVFDVVSEFTLARKTRPHSDLSSDRFERFSKILESKGKFFFLLLVALTIFEVGCGAAGYIFKSKILVNFSVVITGVSILLWFAYMVATIFAQIPGAIKIIRAPFKPLLQLVKHALEVEKPYLTRLAEINVAAVKHVLAHYKNERSAMEKRGSSLSGAIDKVGLFPALGGVALLYLGLKSFTDGCKCLFR